MSVLIFDLFGVIARHQSPAGLAGIEQAAGLSGRSFWEAYWELRPPYDSGDQSAYEYWRAVASAVEADFGDGQIEALIAKDLDSWSEVDDEMVAFVTGLSAETRLGLLSNIPADLATHFEGRHQSWLDAFEVRAFSCRIGHAKPAPGAYSWCLEALKIEPSDAMFIDDRVENIRAAEALGMTGHQFTSLEALRRALDGPRTR
jgi:putative hydrolase of the HAD superfamily